MPPDFNLADTTVDLLTEQAAAFYDFHRKKLFISDWAQTSMRDVALIHELAHALADQVTLGGLKQGLLFPPQSNILETEIKVAARVAQVVFEDGLAGVPRPEDCEAFIRSHVYKPEYHNLV